MTTASHPIAHPTSAALTLGDAAPGADPQKLFGGSRASSGPASLRGTSPTPAAPSGAEPRRSLEKRRAHATESELRARLAAYWPDLYNRALRLSRNDAIAQDVIQDTFERALRFEDQYEPHSNLRAWLQRILLSVFVSRCRRLRRERRALENLMNDPCSWTLPDSYSAPQALSPAVTRALASLPDPFRRAVELVDLADLSYRDAAASLGIPLGTVMSRLHRGRRMLAEALGPETDRETGLREAA